MNLKVSCNYLEGRYQNKSGAVVKVSVFLQENKLLRMLTVLWVLSVAACATNTTVFISSLTDPDYNPTKWDPVFLYVPESAPIVDRQFAALLRSEMQTLGFKLTDNVAQSRYILSFQAGQKTIQLNSTVLLPQIQTTSGYIGDTCFTGQTTSTTAIPTSSDYTVQKYKFGLYSTPDVINSDTAKTVWEGYIGVGVDQFEKYPREILRLLFDVYGVNYQARTPIPQQ